MNDRPARQLPGAKASEAATSAVATRPGRRVITMMLLAAAALDLLAHKIGVPHPALLVLGVNVHVPPISYAGGPAVALAPLSQKIIAEANQDRATAANGGTVASGSPSWSPMVTSG